MLLTTPQKMTLVVDDVISGDFGSYQIKELKGEGIYACVARCIDLSNNQSVAVKISGPMDSSVTKNERDILQKLSSLSEDKNVVKFITSFKYKGYYCLVLENLDQNLYDLMKSRDFKPLNLTDIRYIAKQLLVTFEELAKLKLVHADLKEDNVMLVDHKLQPFKVKLIDFGLSTSVEDLVPGHIVQAIGLQAPEVSLGTKQNEAVDMWSLGCVLAFLFLGKFLFPGDCEYEMMRTVTQIRGMPDVQQLEEGKYTRCFFKKGSGNYKLYLPQEYSALTGRPIVIKPYLPTNFVCLEDMMARRPLPTTEEEKEDSLQFINLLNLLLQVNPANRITPEKALMHPFIASSPSINWSSTPREDGETCSDLSSYEYETTETENGSEETDISDISTMDLSWSSSRSENKCDCLQTVISTVKEQNINKTIVTAWDETEAEKNKDSKIYNASVEPVIQTEQNIKITSRCVDWWPCVPQCKSNRIAPESVKTLNKSKDTNKAKDKPKKTSLIGRIRNFFKN